MIFKNKQKVYRSREVSGNSFLSSEITLVEMVVEENKIRLFLYYTGLDSHYFKILEIPQFVLEEENCSTIKDTIKFLNKNNIFVDKWDETDIQFKFESTILIEKSYRPNINSKLKYNFAENISPLFSSIKNFEHIKLFDNTDVVAKILLKEEEKKTKHLSSLSISGEFILLRNNHSNVLGAIIVSASNNLLLFIEKTTVINCLVVDPKKQKKLGEGRVFALSIQNSSFDIKMEEKKILSGSAKELNCTIASYSI